MTNRDPGCNFMGLNNCCVFLWKINHCAPYGKWHFSGNWHTLLKKKHQHSAKIQTLYQGILSVLGIAGYEWVPSRIGYFYK